MNISRICPRRTRDDGQWVNRTFNIARRAKAACGISANQRGKEICSGIRRRRVARLAMRANAKIGDSHVSVAESRVPNSLIEQRKWSD